ncbi:MAG TPA: ASCH domain-containing protein [Tepidisphaeraceae bacterium]|nr:ASCH domain-containing protein [Tepidisphaeraceae bacterium]
MPLLRFKTVFHQAIKRGSKTTTLRRWNRPLLRPGTTVLAPGIGTLAIERVETINWDDLSEADARADGFASMAEMRSVVKRIYPKADQDGKAWYRVHFHLASAQPKPHKAKKSPPHRRRNRTHQTDRARLAAAVRAELDKAVGQTGS